MPPEEICTITKADLEATKLLGRSLGALAEPGDLVLLEGDLGAGKTTLTQAIAQGLGVPKEEYVTSPTFALLHQYQGRLPLYHMDCYRLRDATEVEDAGLTDYLAGDGLCVVEWPDRLGELIPMDCLWLQITIATPATRNFTFLSRSRHWQQRLSINVLTGTVPINPAS